VKIISRAFELSAREGLINHLSVIRPTGEILQVSDVQRVQAKKDFSLWSK
jgi:hypothetical protein